MQTKDIKEIRAALEIVRKSQDVEFRLRAVISVSTGLDLKRYLRETKRALIFNLGLSFLKMFAVAVVNAICSVIAKAISVLRNLWLGITGDSIQ